MTFKPPPVQNGVGIPRESEEHNKNRSHYPSRSHQPRVSQSDIASRPNAHSQMPSGEASDHPATLTFQTLNTHVKINPIAKGVEISIEAHKLINQSIKQIHSLCPSHSHQLHSSQSNIAPLPNVHWMMPSGEACDNSATSHMSSDRQSIILSKKGRGTTITSIFCQAHSHNPSRLHQLHISQSDIAPRLSVHSVLPIGEACKDSATLTFLVNVTKEKLKLD
jgi:hypothetical protein